jgi:hypothetical protein
MSLRTWLFGNPSSPALAVVTRACRLCGRSIPTQDRSATLIVPTPLVNLGTGSEARETMQALSPHGVVGFEMPFEDRKYHLCLSCAASVLTEVEGPCPLQPARPESPYSRAGDEVLGRR